MESRASDVDSDGTDSLYADSPPAQNPLGGNELQNPLMDNSVTNDDDSESDISMSADSDDENDSPNIASIRVSHNGSHSDPSELSQPESAEEFSKKRKYDSTEKSSGKDTDEFIQEDRKRLKSDGDLPNHRNSNGHLPKDKALLPPEIWHRIFTFCPPKTLGSLMRVNKAFNSFLDTSAAGQVANTLTKSAAHLLSPDIIWKASKRLLDLPAMPTPLSGKSELDMWRISCGSLCQFCNKKRQVNSTIAIDQWHSGPGENGVSPVWAFGIRSCGSCLQTHSKKEIDLLLSSVIPSPLMAALPFVFVTNELHLISPNALQTGQQPSHIQISKYFSNQHIQEIKQEFEDVKSMGTATAEEWLKGLDGRGKERRSDAARWERWEVSGGLLRMRSSDHMNSTTQEANNAKPTQQANESSNVPSATAGNISSYPIPNLQQLQHLAAVLKAQKTTSQTPSIQNNISNPPPRFDSPAQNGFTSFPTRSQAQPKHERTKEEVAELKVARRMEIEKRCMQLDPPITAGVLAHMASFQAAIQIIQPLTDSAWEVLKPRLLSQRGEAEQRENDRIAQTRVVQERFDQLRNPDLQMKSDPKVLDDSQWDDLQAPLRARVGGYADEIIRDGWNGGEKVNYDNSPLFAAEVLIYVRKRFYAEVAKDEAAVRATGREPELDPPDGPYSRKLILENMKWVFDTKVKPHTEPFRKELFVCNACEYANKYYGFEGVIQHFAAKHTSALSMGSIVVHWKSEWPEYPPFNPDPSSVPINAFYPAAPGTNTPYLSTGPSVPPNYGYGGYQPTPVSGSIHVPPQHGYQESPGPYYGHPQFGEQYTGPQNGPYAPPPSYPDNSQSYQAAQYSTAPPGVSSYTDQSQNYSQQGFNGQYQTTAPGAYPPSYSGTSYPTTVPNLLNQQAAYPLGTQYGSSYNPSQSYQANNSSQPPRTEEYVVRLQHVARNARETWNSIGNVKEVPGSLKVYTVIYHLLKSFHATFNGTPPLAMIVDGLSNNKDMRPVRNVNGLLCKACSLGMMGSNSNLPKKHFSFPQLVNHFYSAHEQGIPEDSVGHIPDWTRDMVELPDTAKLTSVVNAPGLDDKKLALFTDAVPEILQPSGSGSDNYREDRHPSYGEYPRSDYTQLAPSQDNHHKYYASNSNSRPSETESVTYESGEYDPRNPGDLSAVSGSFHTEIKGSQSSRTIAPRNDSISSRYLQHVNDVQQDPYVKSSHSYAEQRPPSRVAPAGLYERTREELPLYTDKHVRYLESDEIEYHIKREPPVTYDRSVPLRGGYAGSNSQAYLSNQESTAGNDSYARTIQSRSSDGHLAQQNRIYDVVAQISQQAQKVQQARDQKPDKEDPIDGGSEDGEVRVAASSSTVATRKPATDESNAAERFLNDFRPGEPYESSAPRITRDGNPPLERGGNVRYIYEEREPRRVYAGYEGDVQMVSSTRRIIRPAEELSRDGYAIQERGPPRQVQTFTEEPIQRERSPELVDHRYKLNNAIYLEERQNSQGAYRAPNRYARYESVRLENGRAHSRSPPYVKVGPQPGQYRERSPEAHPQPLYRTQTPPTASEEIIYEMPQRQEYHRVYVNEPRLREARYEEAYELVRVSDPQGDYMIRRPIRREPVYATYEDEIYTRQPVYESRQPLARAEVQFEDEYDPKHPEPPPVPVQVRFQ